MLSVFTLSGCSDDFLDLTPPTDTVGEYFNTQEHVEEALVAAYNPLQWPDWGNGYYCPINLMSDIMADDIWVGGSSKTDNQFWHLMMNFEALPNQTPAGLWTDEYSGVKRANDVLSYINDSRDELSQDFIDKASAEARVLRAINHTAKYAHHSFTTEQITANLTINRTLVSEDAQSAVLKRTLDATTYYVTISWEGAAKLREKSANYFVLTPTDRRLISRKVCNACTDGTWESN